MTPTRQKPRKQSLRIGLIGLGGNARGHGVRLMQIPEVVVAAAADPDRATEGLFHQAHAKAEKVRFFTDYRKMLEQVELDAAVISTPHALHAEQITAALEHGLHVLTEKPLVCSVAEARAVIAKAQATGRHLLVSYQRHLQGPFRYMYAAAHNGELGEIRFVQTFMAQGWLEPTRGTWRQDPALAGGGQLNDSGSHIVDIALWVSNLVPVRVSGFSRQFDAPVDIDSGFSVEFNNGALGSFAILGSYVPNWIEQTSFLGARGALHYMHMAGRETLVHLRADGTPLEVLRTTGHGNPDQHFVDVLLGRCESVLGPQSALRVLALTEAVWKSAASGGQPVDVEAV